MTEMRIRRIITDPIKDLAESGKLGGFLLILATMLSLGMSNSERASAYLGIWHIDIGFDFLHMHVLHWINDGLMAVFFFLVGLEIKRELLRGELASVEKAVLPVLAAIGGMLIPALIYITLNTGSSDNLRGWAIPTATDIAFSLGILSVIGKKVPFSLRIFLTALAIIDDLGAILIIALFYTGSLQPVMFLFAAIIIACLYLLNRIKVHSLWPYVIPFVLLWYVVYMSGIHPTIAGVLCSLFVPREAAHRLEISLHRPVNYFILPLFALANTAIPLTFDPSGLVSSLTIGIILGLFLGKPIGIIFFSWIGVNTGFARLPSGIKWKHLSGAGMLAGIGFTMSIFIAGLSFSSPTVLDLSKLSILAGSAFSAIAGLLVLYFSSKKRIRTG
jgi:NhaA family Na+:H+ antiporter